MWVKDCCAFVCQMCVCYLTNSHSYCHITVQTFYYHWNTDIMELIYVRSRVASNQTHQLSFMLNWTWQSIAVIYVNHDLSENVPIQYRNLKKVRWFTPAFANGRNRIKHEHGRNKKYRTDKRGLQALIIWHWNMAIKTQGKNGRQIFRGSVEV